MNDVGSYLYNAVTFQQLHFSTSSLGKFYFSLALVLKSLEVLHICCIRVGTFILEEEGVERRYLEKISLKLMAEISFPWWLITNDSDSLRNSLHVPNNCGWTTALKSIKWCSSTRLVYCHLDLHLLLRRPTGPHLLLK